MSKTAFFSLLQKEIGRIDNAHTTKRHERIIEKYTNDLSPKAVIEGKEYRIFNSNDYLGLRFNKDVKEQEHITSELYGAGPGAVRFISGTLKVHRDLEKKLAAFHKKDDAMVFSSAFAANIAVISCLIKGQSKDSLVNADTLVVSDALNHRSIIEGIRVANLPSEQRAVYKHLNYEDLGRILQENQKKYKRALVITDGIFSMLGEAVDLKQLQKVIDVYDAEYEQGIMLVVDDSHGVGAFGKTGRGCEEASGVAIDVVVGTLGKAFGADGGYVTANQTIIDYLRESSATYIYSNPISPSVAGAALASVTLMEGPQGKELLKKLQDNIAYFKQSIKNAGFSLAAESVHPIQPLLIGDTAKTKQFTENLFTAGILATAISYPVVPPGKDEIRTQINATHTKDDLNYFVEQATIIGKKLGLI